MFSEHDYSKTGRMQDSVAPDQILWESVPIKLGNNKTPSTNPQIYRVKYLFASHLEGWRTACRPLVKKNHSACLLVTFKFTTRGPFQAHSWLGSRPTLLPLHTPFPLPYPSSLFPNCLVEITEISGKANWPHLRIRVCVYAVQPEVLGGMGGGGVPDL